MKPRLKALYLTITAVGVFLLPSWWLVGLVALMQVGLWLGLRLGLGRLVQQVRKLTFVLAVIVIAYALVAQDPATDRWQSINVLGLSIEINLTGLHAGIIMALRVIAVVLASQIARAGDPRALAAGLRRLGIPETAALSIDAVLALLGDEDGRGRGHGAGGGRGRGHGAGGGRGRGHGAGGGRGHGHGAGGGRGRSWRGFWSGLGRLARGDISILTERMRAQIDRAERHLHTVADRNDSRAMARDVAVIAGVALTMLGIKALKLLPGIPFAPGHKGVILIPLYIAAGFLTRGRAGATLTGLTMGTVAFLLGDGRYGVFEIVKHVAPGVLVDLGMPLLRAGSRAKPAWAWSLFGLVVALGRYATITAIALVVQAPAVVYAVLLPGLLVHVFFGVLSGVVTAPLARALSQREPLTSGPEIPAADDVGPDNPSAPEPLGQPPRHQPGARGGRSDGSGRGRRTH